MGLVVTPSGIGLRKLMIPERGRISILLEGDVVFGEIVSGMYWGVGLLAYVCDENGPLWGPLRWSGLGIL